MREDCIASLRRWCKSHVAAGAGMAISHDSTLLVSLSSDKSVKVFDVHTYDMMAMLRLSFVPGCAAWMYKVQSTLVNIT